jgi:TRAP-type C4-dicarboxylate transport system permease small subunit
MSNPVDDAVAGRLRGFPRYYFLGIAGLASALVVALVTIMGVQVFFRYVLNDSLIWTEEVCRYILLWMTFLFAGVAFQRGEMVSLEIIVGRFPGRSRLLLVVPAYLASLGLLAAIVWYGWKFAQINSFQTVPAADFIWSSIVGEDREVNMSIFWIYVSVPIGMALMFVHVAQSLVTQVAAVLRGEPVGDDAVPPEGWGD